MFLSAELGKDVHSPSPEPVPAGSSTPLHFGHLTLSYSCPPDDFEMSLGPVPLPHAQHLSLSPGLHHLLPGLLQEPLPCSPCLRALPPHYPPPPHYQE